jgi:dTMP kinase
MSGTFITFEGGEGSGKSTHVRLLAERLEVASIECVVTREPGGTPQGEALRSLLVTGPVETWQPTSEALLNYAARAEHLQSVIRPALAEGNAVICDRFMDSTRAYQGYAGGCDMALIDLLEQNIVGTTRPHLTLIMDLDPSAGLERARKRGNDQEARFERKGLAFHERLRMGFADIARNDPSRCKVIDAAAPMENVAADVWRHVTEAMRGG